MYNWAWTYVPIILEIVCRWFSFFGTSLAYLEPEQELFELDDIGNDGGDDLSHHYLPNLKQLYLLHFLGDYKFVRGSSEFDLWIRIS